MADAHVATGVVADRSGVSGLDARGWLAARSLCWREIVRFARQRNRVFGAVGQPLVFWLLFGAGLGPTFQLGAGGGASPTYREYFFPGTIALILLFTAIFTTISVIEDRREGFLQGVLVAPLPVWTLALGKLLGGSLIALAEGLLFLALGVGLGIWPGWGPLAAAVVLMFVLSLALTGLGFVLAWRMDSTQGFHAVMSVFLLPMWLLSGAFFPASEGWLRWVLWLNPMSYGVAGLRRLLAWNQPAAIPEGLPSLTLCWVVVVLFAVVTFVGSCQATRRRTTGDLL